MTRRTEENPGRGRIAVELLNAIQALCGVRLRVVELSDVLGVNLRSTYRILNVIEEQNLPLKSERKGKMVRYWLDKKGMVGWLTRKNAVRGNRYA